jgi:hypothetical protein
MLAMVAVLALIGISLCAVIIFAVAALCRAAPHGGEPSCEGRVDNEDGGRP